MLIVFAGSCKCCELAVVWSYIQQRCGTLLPSPWLRPCLPTLLTYLPSLAVVRDFGFTLNEVNWLGNIVSCVYVLAAFLTPIITKRYGLKRCVWTVSHLMQWHLLISTAQCNIATLLLLSSAWVRYAGTTRSLSKDGAYAFIITAQVGKATLPPVFVLYFR